MLFPTIFRTIFRTRILVTRPHSTLIPGDLELAGVGNVQCERRAGIGPNLVQTRA